MEISLKLSALVLQNFRAFKGYHEIPLSSLNVFVGKNDIGKSTILEAINILLQGEYYSFDKDDICKYKSEDEECIIGGLFTSLPDELIIDETARTTLLDEFLLYKEDTLFYFYKTKTSATLKPFIKANFPSHKKYKTILDKKLEELKELADELSIDKAKYQYQANSKASIRKAVREFIVDNDKKGLALEEQEISIEKEDGKSICDKIKKYLPTYSLFQSDRKNGDQDPEAQDPLKAATKEILGSLGVELGKIEKDVKEYVRKMAEKTLTKLAEMNPELADILEPEFTKSPEWSSVFKYSLKTKDEIPLNKRGSGVRRLILLNFFRAKAEKTLDDELSKQNKLCNSIIYAFEEPETSQHPEHQKLLIESFIELSQKENIQILLSTHSPGIAKLLPPESIRLIKNEKNGIVVKQSDKSILEEVAAELGVLPSIDTKRINEVKLAICLEGHNDVEFLQNINSSISELKSIIDLKDNNVIVLSLGGSNLQFWVNYNYLEKLHLSQMHIYDSDIGADKPHKYIDYVEKINSRTDNSFAFETNKREIENYIHPDLIKNKFNLPMHYDVNWDKKDLVSEIKLTVKLREGKVKDAICSELSKSMTKEQLEQIDAWKEIKSWFLKMKELKDK